MNMNEFTITSIEQFAALTGRNWRPSTVAGVPEGTLVKCTQFVAVPYNTPKGVEWRLFGVGSDGKRYPCNPLRGCTGKPVAVMALPLEVIERDANGKPTGNVLWSGLCWQAVDELPQPAQQAEQTAQQTTKAKVVPNT